jgi:hypothetical protein
MVNEADIQKALDDLESQEVPNYSAAAKKFKIDRRTLQRRHKGISKPKELAYSESHTLLTIEQEEVLYSISHIFRIVIYTYTSILRNLVYEMPKTQPGKNWVPHSASVTRTRLKASIFAQSIKRVKSLIILLILNTSMLM